MALSIRSDPPSLLLFRVCPITWGKNRGLDERESLGAASNVSAVGELSLPSFGEHEPHFGQSQMNDGA